MRKEFMFGVCAVISGIAAAIGGMTAGAVNVLATEETAETAEISWGGG